MLQIWNTAAWYFTFPVPQIPHWQTGKEYWYHYSIYLIRVFCVIVPTS